jgi:uncharacterized protein (DUF2236 family)
MACPMAMPRPVDHNIENEKNYSIGHSESELLAASITGEKNMGVTQSELFSEDWAPKGMQKVAQEAFLLAGGGVAILLQVANPGVGAGVNDHSNFAYRPVDRLRTTMTYVYTMAFGTPAEKKAVIDTVHRAHAPVKGPGYSADDPELQLWVAATLYAAATDIYEKIFGRFDPDAAEQIYREYSILATSLRVPPEMWPPNRVAFWEYWDKMIETIEITPHATNVANDLLRNKNTPFWLRVNLPLIRLLTAEWLPPRIRDAYGLKTSKTRRGMYKFVMGTTKVVYPVMPKAVRTFPMNYYLKDMRKRMKNMA